MSVNGSISDADSGLFRCICSPLDVFIKVGFDFSSPYETVQRADHLDLEAVYLLEDHLYLLAVLSDDVGVISSGFVHVFSIKVYFISEDRAVQSSEGSKSIS